jgi:Flp pilus assembly protein TadD
MSEVGTRRLSTVSRKPHPAESSRSDPAARSTAALIALLILAMRLPHAAAAESAPPLTAGAQQNAADLTGAKLLIRQGKASLAIPALRADHDRDPANREIAVMLARAYALSGDRGQAIALLDDVIAMHPADVSARAALGQTYALNGDFNAAEAQYRVALAADPGDIDSQNGLARAYALEGRAADARRLYDAVLTQHADNPEALVGRADVASISGDLRAARAGYRTALEVEPDDVQTMIALARIELELGDFAATSRLMSRALAESPGDLEAVEVESALRGRLAPTFDVSGSQTIGNGVEQSNTALAPRFYLDPRLQFEVVASRFTLAQGAASASADRIGVSAAYSDDAADTARLSIAHSQFAGLPPTIDASASVAGARHGVDYRLGFQSGGIDLAASAAENLISPSGAGIRVDKVFADVGASTKPFAVHAHGLLRGYSDTNRYREFSLDVDRRLALGDRAYVMLSAAGRAAAFSENYSAYLSHGYYDYTAQSDITLSALAAARLGARSDAGILALVGQRHTTRLVGSSGAQPFSRFEPYFDIDAGPLRLSASGVVARYGSAPWVPTYYSSALRVDARLRI